MTEAWTGDQNRVTNFAQNNAEDTNKGSNAQNEIKPSGNDKMNNTKPTEAYTSVFILKEAGSADKITKKSLPGKLKSKVEKKIQSLSSNHLLQPYSDRVKSILGPILEIIALALLGFFLW